MTVRIGLTGGIGSGKSTVAAEFAACGAWLVDIDVISRALTEPGGDAVAAVAQVFGCDMIDSRGALDRERMRALGPTVRLDLGKQAEGTGAGFAAPEGE